MKNFRALILLYFFLLASKFWSLIAIYWGDSPVKLNDFSELTIRLCADCKLINIGLTSNRSTRAKTVGPFWL